VVYVSFFFQAEDGIRDFHVTGVQTCALPICKDNYPVDRELGDRVKEVFPGIVTLARAGRYFLARVVRFMAGEAGLRQFLDIGTRSEERRVGKERRCRPAAESQKRKCKRLTKA